MSLHYPTKQLTSPFLVDWHRMIRVSSRPRTIAHMQRQGTATHLGQTFHSPKPGNKADVRRPNLRGCAFWSLGDHENSYGLWGGQVPESNRWPRKIQTKTVGTWPRDLKTTYHLVNISSWRLQRSANAAKNEACTFRTLHLSS